MVFHGPLQRKGGLITDLSDEKYLQKSNRLLGCFVKLEFSKDGAVSCLGWTSCS